MRQDTKNYSDKAIKTEKCVLNMKRICKNNEKQCNVLALNPRDNEKNLKDFLKTFVHIMKIDLFFLMTTLRI